MNSFVKVIVRAQSTSFSFCKPCTKSSSCQTWTHLVKKQNDPKFLPSMKMEPVKFISSIFVVSSLLLCFLHMHTFQYQLCGDIKTLHVVTKWMLTATGFIYLLKLIWGHFKSVRNCCKLES